MFNAALAVGCAGHHLGLFGGFESRGGHFDGDHWWRVTWFVCYFFGWDFWVFFWDSLGVSLMKTQGFPSCFVRSSNTWLGVVFFCALRGVASYALLLLTLVTFEASLVMTTSKLTKSLGIRSTN